MAKYKDEVSMTAACPIASKTYESRVRMNGDSLQGLLGCSVIRYTYTNDGVECCLGQLCVY